MTTFNQWFLSLPEGRQKALRDEKWALAEAAFDHALAERDAALAQNAELVAQVGALRKAILDYVNGKDKPFDLIKVLDVTPSQCLRQIQADAVLEFAKQYKNKYEMLPATASPTVISFANEYAAKVRQGDVQ